MAGKTLTALLLRRSGPVPLEKMAETLARLRGWEPEEAPHMVVRSGGVILRDAGPDEVREIGAILRKRHLPFVLIPTDKLPEVTEQSDVDGVEVHPDRITLRRGDAEVVVPQKDFLLGALCVLSAGAEAAEEWVLSVVTTGPMRVYHKRFRTDEEREIRRVITALYDHWPRSQLNRGVRSMARGEDAGTPDVTFRKTDYLNSYVMWLAYLAYYARHIVGAPRRGLGVSALGRVRFLLERNEVDASVEKKLERRAVESRSRRLRPVGAADTTAVRQRGSRVGVVPEPPALAPLLEESVLLKVAVAAAVVAILIWFVRTLS